MSMKLAVIKIGARITWDTDGAVAPGEAISICKALSLGGAEVHVFTKILSKDTLHPSLTWNSLLEPDGTMTKFTSEDVSSFDALVVINGNVNFFGGAEDVAQIANYVLLNKFTAPVFYVMCDPELQFTQIWDMVNGKQEKWLSAYTQEQVFIQKEIYVLSQPFDLEKIKATWEKTKRTVKAKEFFHFPMERFPLLNEWLPPVAQPAVDLLYGGTPRGGLRIPNLYKWYWNIPSDISVEIFGSIGLIDFIKHPKLDIYLHGDSMFMSSEANVQAPKFSGKVKYDQVLPKMNSALAHLVTGDPSYERLDIIPQRTYECIAAGNIVFIDAAMDPSRRIYPTETMAHDFLYVRSQEDLVERLRILKSDPLIRDDLWLAQRDATSFDADEFCKSLVNKLKSFV